VKVCQDEPKKYNSSCERKENNGIAGFYSDETYEVEIKTANELKNSSPYKAYRSLIRKSVVPKRVKGEGRLVEALRRLTSKNETVNHIKQEQGSQIVRKKRSASMQNKAQYDGERIETGNQDRKCDTKFVDCPVSCCK